jgi:hypothetical protein
MIGAIRIAAPGFQKMKLTARKPIDLAGELDSIQLRLPTTKRALPPDSQPGIARGSGLQLMETAIRPLIATPEGMLHLFLDGGVSIQHLAFAFETDAYVIESAVREAIRKREAITRAALPSGVELIRPLRGTG